MPVAIGQSPLDFTLGKAQELMTRGKEGPALDQLWEAEAIARGDADSLRQASDVVATLRQQFGSRQASELAQLIEVLQHDLEVASRTTPPRSDFVVATTLGSVAKGLGIAFLWAMGGGIAGALIGGVVGRATENPNEMLASLDPFVGAVIGFPIGAVVGLLLCGIWVSSRPR